ncbi:MAG: hypothetical protein PHH11_15210 [Methylomonas sp.]|nr:hypothetical protein [Methylomonas sp.]
MTKYRFAFLRQWAIALLTISIISPVYADKPPKAGKPNPSHHKKHAEHKRKSWNEYPRVEPFVRQRYFNDQHRNIINSYYVDAYRRGQCPPGLAKKQNGCWPPGHAKRWSLGRPLPRDVIFYDLPDNVIRQIGYPPAGYRLVRVASDILMIAIGSGLVVDALADLTGLP